MRKKLLNFQMGFCLLKFKSHSLCRPRHGERRENQEVLPQRGYPELVHELKVLVDRWLKGQVTVLV